MSINVEVNWSRNPEQNFFRLRINILNIAKEQGVPVTEIIDKFLEDLENLYKEDYKKNVEDINIKEITPSILKSLISYMNRMKKTYEKKEKDDENRQKQKEKKEASDAKKKELEEKVNELISGRSEGTELDAIKTALEDINNGQIDFGAKDKKQIIQELEKRLEEENEKERKAAKESAKKEAAEKARQAEIENKVAKTWQEIEGIADREIKKGIKGVKCWTSIRDNFNKQESDSDDQTIRNKILGLLDEKVSQVKDDEYFEQVKYFTRDFSFLRELPELIKATSGVSIRKFTDKEAYDRFYDLRASLQRGISEYGQINILLENKNTTDGDRRILLARKSVMDKEIEKRKAEGR